MEVRLLKNTFESQKNESVHFYACPEAKLSFRFLTLPFQAQEITHFPQKQQFLKICFSQQKKTKIKLARVLVTSFDKFTIFATCTLLVFVLLCHNFDSSMLKCEGSLI